MIGLASLSILGIGLAAMIPVHLFQFLGLRVRNAALPEGERDSQLGRKFALGVFHNLSILMILVGVTLSVVDLLDYVFEPNRMRGGGFGGPRGQFGPGGGFNPGPARGEWFNEVQRTAAGLILSGFLHFALFAVILMVATNNGTQRLVSRSFVVARLLLAGLITMGATTGFLVSMLQKGDTNYEALKIVLGLGLVWGPTALAHLLMMMAFRDGRRGRDDRRSRDDDDDRDDRRRY